MELNINEGLQIIQEYSLEENADDLGKLVHDATIYVSME